MHSRTLLATTLAALTHLSHALSGPWCFTYFGYINATIDLSEVTPEYNYDGTVKCPTTWTFPRESGAMFSICPPYGGPITLTSDAPGDLALDVELMYNAVYAHLTPRGIRTSLRDIYVTNGSHSNPDPDTGAIPVGVRLDSNDHDEGPKFSIKGTQSSLLPYKDPEEPDYRWNVLTCEDYHETVDYCAAAPYDKVDEECWKIQTFILTPDTDLNYTISFSGSKAVVDMSFAGEVESKGTSFARMRFEGDHAIPGGNGENMTLWLDGFDTIFHSKPEQYFNEELGLDVDENGVLMLRNLTAQEDEVYFASNKTFWRPTSVGNAVVSTGRLGMMVFGLIAQVLI